MRKLAFALCVAAALGFPQTYTTLTTGSHRMELVLERLDKDTWRPIDPGLVLEQGDRVRFKFRTNFPGYLYVMNQGTGGNYQQLFPREETGQDNQVLSGREYQVPATSGAFRVAGPPGHDIVYWLVSPGRLTDGAPGHQTPAVSKSAPPTLIPRCDETILRARGDCVDSTAGPKLVPRGTQMPSNLTAQGATPEQRDLIFLRQKNTAVIATPEPLTGPIVYEFRLAHR